MKYRRMSLNCDNNLDIYGTWEDLKLFYCNNFDEKNILKLEDILIVDWEKELMEERMEMISYVFMTKEDAPVEWLERMAGEYPKLDFNLVYQNREKDSYGEIIYKNGELYHNSRIFDEICYQEVAVS